MSADLSDGPTIIAQPFVITITRWRFIGEHVDVEETRCSSHCDKICRLTAPLMAMPPLIHAPLLHPLLVVRRSPFSKSEPSLASKAAADTMRLDLI